jgi:hypothetical protein
MSWINFNLIHSDLASLIRNNVPALTAVFQEADERDIRFDECPLADVRLRQCRPQIRAGQDYYVEVYLDIEIISFSLKNNDDAATVRDSVLSSVIDTVRANSKFSGQLLTSRIDNIEFGLTSDEEQGNFVAGAVVTIMAEAYADRS